MNDDQQALIDLDEPFAAGFLVGETPLEKISGGFAAALAYSGPTEWSGQPLYPCGINTIYHHRRLLRPDYSFSLRFDRAAWEEKLSQASLEDQSLLRQLRNAIDSHLAAADTYENELREHCTLTQGIRFDPALYGCGGFGFTHAIIAYERVLAEGLQQYEHRTKAYFAAHTAQQDFYSAMLRVLAGIRSYQQMLVQTLQAAETPESKRLLQALRRVPWEPPRSFYEAVVSLNVLYYVDGCDNPGRLDQVLWPYFKQDTTISREEAVELLSAFYDNVDANNGWSAALGGTLAGEPMYNELTELCLEAAARHRRPSIELRVDETMPDSVWETALQTLATGCGQPAFYNEPAYNAALREHVPGLTEEELFRWNGGGCTETMLAGLSHVGSIDCGINVLWCLEQALQCALAACSHYEQFWQEFCQVLDREIARSAAFAASRHQTLAAFSPQPVRSLLIDDCLARGRDFNQQQAARYNWSVFNVAGLTNSGNGLYAIKHLIYDEGAVTPEAMLHLLAGDFASDPSTQRQLQALPKFGSDNDEVDTLVAQLADHVADAIARHTPWRGGCFAPAVIMFSTYANLGRAVGATPDGRSQHEPLASSVGPATGQDKKGPTAMLRSTAKLPLNRYWGTPVLNLSLSSTLLQTTAGRGSVRALVETYFQAGGMQLQITVLNREQLQEAVVDPASHPNLIVRIGGFSEYFHRLSPELQADVIARTEH